MHYGGDWNPEQWPEKTWGEDVRLMTEAGITLVRTGTHGWARTEPAPGAWDFGWLDRALDLLADAGVDVVLSTMTGGPPPWLLRRHPEAAPDGTACPSGPVRHTYATRLVEQLARRYGDHPAVALWHIGDVYGSGHGCARPCGCEACEEAFREWLRARYGSLDALNSAWTTAVRSQTYGAWEEVRLPGHAGSAGECSPDPARLLDRRRFTHDALLGCFLAEREVLRALTPEVPVTTGFLPLDGSVDQFGWARHQDVVALGPAAGSGEAAGPGGPLAAAAAFDAARGAGGGQPWMLLDHGPAEGPWPPGALRLRAWQAVAQGADAVLPAPWRQPRGGAGRFRAALVPHAGTASRMFTEARALGHELAAAPAELEGSRVSAVRAALVLDWPSRWALEQSPAAGLDAPGLLLRYHAPLLRSHVACDVVPPGRDLTGPGYRLVVVPHLHLLSVLDARRLAGYVRGGGHLLVGCCSGIVDESARLHGNGWAAPLRELLGVTVEEPWPLAEGVTVPVEGGPAGSGHGSAWAEVLTLDGAEAVARFTGGPAAGGPAVTRHSYGDGVAWYVATRLDAGALERLLGTACARAGAEPVLPGLPREVQAAERRAADGTRFVLLLNHGARQARCRLPQPMRDVLTPGRDADAPVYQVTLPPGGVAVLSAAPPGA
ncbi:beta-galactosidase [Streptomyces sp. NRRL S-1868]|uniref:beta-galactosidase n=1 Tax=Streptomyces sp. NRRL S-1868 TaxID=1463892 RepID=UPI00055F8EC8|nr:beta-galactosidase [Streptomyces sp. NRRL S-1868]